MKNKMNKLFILAASVFSLSTMASCNSEWDSNKINIGILQYAVHGALDEACAGFKEKVIEGLGKDNVNIVYKNAGGVSSNNSSLAEQLATSPADLLFGIATPSAQVLKNQVFSANKTTPILFTAVTDPVAAELIASNESTGCNVSGTNDMNPVDDQIALFKEINPNISSIGILYCSSESNSKTQSDLAEAKAKSIGISKVEVGTVSDSSNISSTIDSLVSKGIEGLYIPTDNIIAAAMGTVFQACKSSHLPIICGESNMLKKGGLFSLGVDYHKLGVKTGEMAIDILKNNKKPSEIPSVGLSTFPLYINTELCTEMGLTVPSDMISRATIIETEE